MDTKRFAMPLVFQDLPPTEALHQVFDNLKHLEAVCNDVFGRLSQRIGAERAKIQGICSRVAQCKSRVEQVAVNQSKATTVYSTTKYPAPKELPDFIRVNDQHEDHALRQVTRAKWKVPRSERLTGSQSVDTTALFTELTGNAPEERHDVNIHEGLGRLPAYLPSVSSVLLFNSSENPYRAYVSLDNLEGVGGKDREQIEEELAAAPQTLVDGAFLPTFAAPQLLYTPELGEVPTFDLPENLPLGQLADIRFDGSEHASIAPSVSQLPSLPSVEQFQQQMAPSNRKKQGDFNTNTVSAPTATANTAQAPTPGGPTTSVGAPPPPAPPAGTPAPPAPPAPAAPPAATKPGPSGGGGGGRSDLLAAIRNPGIRLKKAAERVRDDNRKKKKAKKRKNSVGGEDDDDDDDAGASSSGGGMDMMSALRNALARRRAATSGKEVEDAGDNSDVSDADWED